MKRARSLLSERKGDAFKSLGALVLSLAVVAIVLVITFVIISQGRSQIATIDGVNASDASTYSVGYNATLAVATAVDDVPSWLGLFVLVGMGAVLIGLVFMIGKMNGNNSG